jgi:uncharacterized membrane protein/thiol-disulfide isomerase/thioredoxin
MIIFPITRSVYINMNRRTFLAWLLLAAVFLLWSPTSSAAQEAETPVVHAVLFYSPTCPHCHEAINNVMIPLMDQYGDQLVVAGLDVSTEVGQYLYQSAVAYYKVPENRRGVPTLVIQDTVLVSTMEIENAFPGLIEAGLAADGIDWPAFPGLAEVVVALDVTATPGATTPGATTPGATTPGATTPGATTPEPTPAVTLTPTAASSPASGQTVETAVPSAAPTAVPPASADEGGAALALAEIDPDTIATEEPAPPPDPVGFLLAWLVVIALAVVMVFAVWRVIGSWPQLIRAEVDLVNSPGRTMLFWALIGLGLIVSGYLAYVETMHVTAVCGPVGECNLVQSSPYARILGVPVAVLGLLFYLALAALWLLQRVEALRGPVIWGLAALTLFGTLFSIYLTLVELLLIHAVCAWCLTSAVVTGLLCVLVMTGVVKRPLSPEPQWQPTD